MSLACRDDAGQPSATYRHPEVRDGPRRGPTDGPLLRRPPRGLAWSASVIERASRHGQMSVAQVRSMPLTLSLPGHQGTPRQGVSVLTSGVVRSGHQGQDVS